MVAGERELWRRVRGDGAGGRWGCVTGAYATGSLGFFVGGGVDEREGGVGGGEGGEGGGGGFFGLEGPGGFVFEGDDVVGAVGGDEAAVEFFAVGGDGHVPVVEDGAAEGVGGAGGEEDLVVGIGVVDVEVGDEAGAFGGGGDFEVEGGVVPGGVFDGVFVAAGEVAGGDVFCVVGPGGLVVVGEGDHEVAEDGFAGAEGDVGFVAGEDGGGHLVGVEGAVVEVWAIVAGEGVGVDGVEGGLKGLVVDGGFDAAGEEWGGGGEEEERGRCFFIVDPWGCLAEGRDSPQIYTDFWRMYEFPVGESAGLRRGGFSGESRTLARVWEWFVEMVGIVSKMVVWWRGDDVGFSMGASL